ncbi:MAG: YqjF family protein [Gaiellaceae bacterium]
MTDFLDAPLRQAASLERLDHRPWPVPAQPWSLGQSWEDLLFAHWPIPAGRIEPRIPDGLDVDTFGGSAWLGVAAFRLTNLRLRGTLPLPFVSSFLELNVRTYVTAGDKPGVWFFSLDASSGLAVEAARRTYSLPYFRARMSATQRGTGVEYECARIAEPGRAFSGRYGPTGPASEPPPGSLESFLAERYCLYALDGSGQLARAEIHHEPWPLQPAEAELDLNTMPPIELPGDEPLCHFCRRQDAVLWPLRAIGAC